MTDDQVLIVGGLGNVYGGGLLVMDGAEVRRIDAISTMGIAFDGRRFARNLRCPPEEKLVGEIVVYDEGGVTHYLRLDDAAAVHDIAWDGDALAIASTWHNAVRWFGLDGRMIREVRYPGDLDSSHVNCITRHDGVWYATVFSRQQTFRAWDTAARRGAGMIVELETGRVVVEGLSSPHTPRRLDDLWLVCNSLEQELAVFDGATGAPVRRVPCGLWTRGLAFTGDVIYVGGCRRRHGPPDASSVGDGEIVVIDRTNWTIVERIATPSQEIYEMVFVPRSMLGGLERGFDVNPRRTAEARQWAMLAELGCERPRSLFPTGEPLPWSDFRCRIEATLPAQWTVGEMREVGVRVTNPTPSFFTSAPPAPIFVSYKWIDVATGDYLDDVRAYRNRLPRTLQPNESFDLAMRIVAPSRAGRALLRVTLVQEGVSWFDDQDPASALEVEADIAPAPPAGEQFVPVADGASSSGQASHRAGGAAASAGASVFVSGNCHARTVAACLHAANPELAVTVLNQATDPATVVPDGALVVRQRIPRHEWSLRPPSANEVLFPRLPYNGFHPDCLLLPSRVLSPVSGYHSSLVLYGWHRGLTVAQTVALFDERVYETLGFFDFFPAADQVLIEEGRTIGFELDAMLARWRRGGCFMHAINHPKLRIVADVARELMARAGIPVLVPDFEEYLVDPLLAEAVWPVYPELGARWGLPGAYAFMAGYDPRLELAPGMQSLETFVAGSFAAYENLDPAKLTHPRLEQPAYRDLERMVDGPRAVRVSVPPPRRTGSETSPYASLPDERFWRRAVERIPATAVDPVADPPFRLDAHMKVAALGSCFAQRVTHALDAAGFDVLTADCGNVYTARQLLQLFDRAFGTFVPADEAWLRADGRYVDPFRPNVVAAGFPDPGAVRAARDAQLAATRSLFSDAGVIVLTLGLTETWFARADGAAFPLAPGVVGGEADAERYGFRNATVAEITADLRALVDRVRTVNPSAQIVLTVSPQPPIATYVPRHVLVSATYAKSALRAAVDEVEAAYSQVTYFPSYEIIANAFSRGIYYENDKRSVNAAGVDRVMRLFFRHYAGRDDGADGVDPGILAEARRDIDVLCDEDELDIA